MIPLSLFFFLFFFSQSPKGLHLPQFGQISLEILVSLLTDLTQLQIFEKRPQSEMVMALSYLAWISLHLLLRREFQGSLDTFRMSISTDSGMQIMWDISNYLIVSLQSCLCVSHILPKQTLLAPAKLLVLLSYVCVPRTTSHRASQVAQVNGNSLEMKFSPLNFGEKEGI